MLDQSVSALWSAARPKSLQKLHALAGAVPLAAFLVLHLWNQSAALAGRRRYEQGLDWERSLATPVLEAFGIYIPLLFHAAVGIKLSFEAQGPGRYPAGRSRAGLLQRLSALPLAAFLALHLWQFRVRLWTGELAPADFFPELCASLSSTVWGGVPLMAIAYLMGVLAAAFHFYNGLCGFCFSWAGSVASARALRRLSGLLAVAAVGLCVLGTLTVISLATGSSFVAGSGH